MKEKVVIVCKTKLTLIDDSYKFKFSLFKNEKSFLGFETWINKTSKGTLTDNHFDK